jgi:Short C-terminal domain
MAFGATAWMGGYVVDMPGSAGLVLVPGVAPVPERDPLRLLAELRSLLDSGAISAAEFEIRKSAIWRRSR